MLPKSLTVYSFLSYTSVLVIYTFSIFYLLGLPSKLTTLNITQEPSNTTHEPSNIAHESYSQRRFQTKDAEHVVIRRHENGINQAQNGTNTTTDLLFLVLTNDEESFGYVNHRRRSLQDYLELLVSTKYPMQHASIGILTSSSTEYKLYESQLKEFMGIHQLRGFTLILNSGYGDFGIGRNTTARHSLKLQRERRRMLARLRNYLMTSALDTEDGMFWLDSDMFKLPDGLIQEMLRIQKPIITARCRKGGSPDYDKNAWVGPRKSPTAEQLEAMAKGEIFVPFPTPETKFLSNFGGDDPIELDSVGGTTLYLDASMIRQGVNFPPYYVIGTTWTSGEGWDGIETEGVCYVARNLGYSCWGLTGKWEAEHMNEDSPKPLEI